MVSNTYFISDQYYRWTVPNFTIKDIVSLKMVPKFFTINFHFNWTKIIKNLIIFKIQIKMNNN